MLLQKDLLRIKPMLKPVIFDAIWMAEGVFDENEYEDHEQEMTALLNQETSDLADLASSVEDIYDRHLRLVLNKNTVEVAEVVTLYHLATLVTVINDMVRPENADILEHAAAVTENGGTFLCTIADELTDVSFAGWLPIIIDFDETSLPMIRVDQGEDLTEKDVQVLGVYRSRALALRDVLGRDSVAISADYIRTRQPVVAFGYNYRLAFGELVSRFDALRGASDFATLAKELAFLAAGSSLDDSESISEIIGEMEARDFDVREIMNVQKHLKNLQVFK